VILGTKGSATLQLGQTCNLVLLPNTSTTLVAKEQQICVQMVGQQKTAGSTIVSPEATYGQSTNGQQEFGPPEILFGLALGATAAGYAFDDDDDEGAPPVSQ
jgi:hypothetical protein